VSASRTGAPSRGAASESRGSAPERQLAELLVLVTVGIWSANFVVVKAAVDAVGPLTFTSARYVVAAITLFLLVRWRLGSVRPPARSALTLVGLGMLGFGGYQVLWTIGLTQITAGDSALIIAASPVLVALLAGAVGMDRVTAPKLLGALVAFTGVAVVVVAGHDVSLGESLVGDLLTLGAAVLWAIYTVSATRMLRSVHPLQATAWAVLGGTFVLVPFGIAEIARSPAVTITLPVILAVIYSGSLAAAVANVFVFNAIRLVGPTRVTVTQLLVPAGAVVLGAIFLSEPVGVAQVAGGAVIVLGVWLTRRPVVVPDRVRSSVANRRRVAPRR
jgi:drug/metabolite transporter (DMT)-like permease